MTRGISLRGFAYVLLAGTGLVIAPGEARAQQSFYAGKTIDLIVSTGAGGGHDSNAEEISTTHRGRALSRNPKAGHHNIGFRCASTD